MSIFDRVLIWDTETTIYKHQDAKNIFEIDPRNRVGSANSSPQKLVMSGFKWTDDPQCENVVIRHKEATNMLFCDSTLIVGFNLKFDILWAKRIGVDISKVVLWDCQIAEFLLNKQTPRYPSMNGACEKYGIPLKLDVVKEEYWDKSIDTDYVPHDILREYLYGDLDRTERIFKEQVKQFKGIDL